MIKLEYSVVPTVVVPAVVCNKVKKSCKGMYFVVQSWDFAGSHLFPVHILT